MAKTKISEFSATPGNNTDIDGINIAEGCAPSGINDAIRELMAQLKDWQAGTSNDPYVVGSSGSLTLSYGTANGVPYLNGSKVLTSGSALTFDGTNLGIGTSSPGVKLDVSGAMRSIVSGGTPILYLNNGTTQHSISNTSGRLAFTNDGTEGMALTSTGLGIGTSSPGAKVHALTPSATAVGFRAGNSVSYAEFQVDTSGNSQLIAPGGTQIFNTNGSERVRITSAGDVGIGTSSPTAGGKLDVNGIAYFGTGDKVKIYSNNILQTAGTLDIGTIGSAALILNTANIERARIDSSGALLVGTTSSTNAGRITAASDSAGSLYPVYVNNTNTGSSSQIVIDIARNGTRVGSISNTNTATAYATSSDYRLKENIQPMTGALAKVAALKPVTYTWKADGSAGEGFIAHELAEVCPQAVTGEKDAVDSEGKPQYQGIDVSFLVGTLTAAIKEQQAIITALTARVTALETN